MNAYLRLLRFDKPVGIALLWAPTAWALWLANHGMPSWRLLCFFFLGTVLMRAAGCVINDLADRRIDKAVKRTALRPLASGELKISQAIAVLFGLLSLAGLIVIQLPMLCWVESGIALVITFIYPFGKRWFKAPQLILGLAFSMGIPMAFTASGVAFNATMAWLMLLNFLWIVVYDTQYALMDKDDDLLIGVYSTAIWFGSKLPTIMVVLPISFHSLWLFLGMTRVFSEWFDFCWLLGAAILCYQHILLRQQNSSAYMRAFLWHAVYGLVMWVGLF